MTFKPSTWRPIAFVLSAANLAAAGYAAAMAEPWHATIHAGLTLAFGLWARRLRPPVRAHERQDGLEALEAEVNELRRELTDARERLDFTERLLERRPESQPTRPER